MTNGKPAEPYGESMQHGHLGKTPLLPQSTYVRELRPDLPAGASEPARSRLVLIPVHLAVITAAILAIAAGWVPWPLVPLLSLAIGVSFACLTFVGHEAVHGGIVR